ncbi:Protein kinase domain-containing protein [Aphelenchoides bicaudatus]|nr:Protein kinase domain-containing protein [Aphelenchoides bicaudatus]
MPSGVGQKPGSLKDPAVAQIFSTKDPEARYYDLREVGSGSFGNVYYAQDRETNETVAIKKMNFSGKDATEKWNDIIKEVRFLKNLKHPNIVEYRACFLKHQTCWLIQEYCIGSACDILSVFKDQLVEDAIAEICDQTLSALAYIHSLNYIHRDIKAGNILITDKGIVKLADLGSASLQSPANSFVGSPFWIAPEVVLAMEEGEYSTKADIWSLGITTIELANRKPPLYDMNTMSALYYIAQNAPPTLSKVHPIFENVIRSDDIISFVKHCLQREPKDRPSAQECKEHSFLRRPRKQNVMANLVRHTKKRVRKMDNDVYAKMKKIFYLDATTNQGGLSSSSSEDEDQCFVSHEKLRKASINGKNKTLEAGKENIKNGHALRPASSDNDLTLVEDEPPSYKDNEGTSSTLDAIPDELGEAETLSINSSSLPKNRTVISISENEEDSESTTAINADITVSSGQTAPKNINDEINTLKRSKFETLRPTKIITREMEEARRENNSKEQMRVYQQLRQRHHRELQQLEERCKFEADTLRQRQEKEYEQYVFNAQREIHKLRAVNQTQLEKKARENDDLVKKLRKTRVNSNEYELKSFINCQKREYKFNKEQAKRQFKERGLRKSSFEEAMKRTKSDLMLKWNAAESKYVAEQKEHLQMEVLELRQRCQNELQCLEKRLMSGEHSVRRTQLETAEQYKMSHHNSAREQALNHFNECASMKKRHLQVQHESELNNQTDYTRQAQVELKKQHGLKQKNLPRELKLKETNIKKQFRQVVILFVVFSQNAIKAVQNIPSSNNAERAEGRAKRSQCASERRADEKDCQLRRSIKLNLFLDNNTIQKMVSEQTIQLDSSQEEETRQLNEKLNQELNSLLEFQNRQKENLETSCLRELESLNAAWLSKKTALKQIIDNDRMKFETERSKQLETLESQQEKERLRLETLDLFKSESSFNAAESRHGQSVPASPFLHGSVPNRLTERYNSNSPTTSSRSSPSQSTNL